MFNALFLACKSIFHFNNVLSDVTSVLSNLEDKFSKDKNAKDAAIYAICEILQAHKSSVQTK